MRRYQAECVRTHLRRVGGDRKAADSASAYQAVNFAPRDLRQIRWQDHQLPTTEIAQHPMGLSQRGAEAFAAVGKHRDFRGYGIALRTDHDDLTHRLRATSGQ